MHVQVNMVKKQLKMISFKKTIASAYELYVFKPAYYHKDQKNMNNQEFLTINILELNRETKC